MKQKDAGNQGVKIQQLLSYKDVEYISPVYALKSGYEIGFSNEVVVKFRDHVDTRQKAAILKTFNLKLVTNAMPVFESYALPADMNVIVVANWLYETGLCEFAHPYIVCEAEMHSVFPNDPYFQYQVALHNTGQVFTDGHTGTPDADIDAPEAWEITMGSSNIVVAVIDEGVTSDHPDLPNTRQVRLPGSNFRPNTPNPDDPSPYDTESHGNACAGIIAASMNNSEDITGIAPNCKIMPIKIGSTNPQIAAQAILFAVDHGANIISNSWGFGDNTSNANVLVAAIQYAINHGVVVLFSAGNTAAHSLGENGNVVFPANANIDGLITVGASDRYDYQADYSPTSSLIDIVAPSHRAYTYPESIYTDESWEMWTLDNPGTDGCNPWWDYTAPYPLMGEMLPDNGPNHLAYTGRFGGTSYACPVVAGGFGQE